MQARKKFLIIQVTLFFVSNSLFTTLGKEIDQSFAKKGRLDRLIDLFSSGRPLHLEYDLFASLSPEEALEKNKGNCLTSTILFTVAAQHLGLNAEIYEVSIRQRYDRHGNLVISNNHVLSRVRIGEKEYEIDFGRESERIRGPGQKAGAG